MVEMSELRDKIDKFTDEIEAKNMELQTMPGHLEKTFMFRRETAKPQEVTKKSNAYVSV